jgi:hypothetical protein
MIRPLAQDGAHRLMEEDGIGYYFAASHEGDMPCADFSKNEVSIESVTARPESVEGGTQHDRDVDPLARLRFLSGDRLHPYARVVTDNKDDGGGY